MEEEKKDENYEIPKGIEDFLRERIRIFVKNIFDVKSALTFLIMFLVMVILYGEAEKHFADHQIYALCMNTFKVCNSSRFFVSCSPSLPDQTIWNFTNKTNSSQPKIYNVNVSSSTQIGEK